MSNQPTSLDIQPQVEELPEKSSALKIIGGIFLGIIAYCSLSLLFGIFGRCEKKCNLCLQSKTERIGFILAMVCAGMAIGIAVIYIMMN